METLLQDLKYGIRMLVRNPGFAVVSVVTLALGIGANTAIFSIVNGVLLRPLPYKDASRVMVVWQNDLQKGVTRDDFSPANFLDVREQNQVFEAVTAADPWSFDLTGDGEPEAFRAWLVYKDFFQVLGANALHGRVFSSEDYQPGNDRVIIIGYKLWQRRFGQDPNVIGKVITLRDQPYTIVGVMPPEFQFPAEREVWSPRTEDDRDRQIRAGTFLKVAARLKPGVSVEQARENLGAIMSRLAEQYPETNREIGITVVPLPDQLLGQVRPALFVLLGAVGFVLLIACANVANLLLVRGARRQKEFAIRSALGAARARLVRQLLTENLLLAVLGGIGGILLASWAIDAALALAPADLPRLEAVSLDGQVLGFASGLSMLTAIVFGMIPSMHFSRPDLNESLKEGGRSAGGAIRHRLRNVLIISEVALALVLLVGAGLLVRSFVRLIQVDPGFSADKVATLEVHVWRKYQKPETRAAFFEQTLERISNLPGVKSAGAVSALPFIASSSSIDIESTFAVEGRAGTAEGQEPSAFITFATADYFSAMGIQLERGRTFTRFDDRNAPQVAVISESMARRFFPEEDPIGKKLNIKPVSRYFTQATREIVGIVRDVKHTGLDSDPRPEIYLPHPQGPSGSMTFVVRTSGDPAALLPEIKNQIWAVNKDIPFSSTATVEQLVSGTLAERRFNLLLLASFAVIALVLAGVGIYGLISFSVSQRTHEIGIRMALGARASDVLYMILRQGVALALIGIAIGITGAAILTRFLSAMLYGVSATDPVTFAAIPLILLGVALGASFVPARRATRVDPMEALRYE